MGMLAQMILNRLGNDATGAEGGLNLDLDSGLGVFDAFFASFSMILVSEVSVLLLFPGSCVFRGNYLSFQKISLLWVWDA